MTTHGLRIAMGLLLALAGCSLAAAAEESKAPPVDAAVDVAPAPVPASDCGDCGNCTRKMSKAARFWDWLTYQPECKPNKCCKMSAMPACPPRLYWFFPCVDSCGQCPMGGYAAKCGCNAH